MRKLFSLAFGQCKTPHTPNLTIEHETMRGIVASHSHGNVRLQAGRFYTREDVDAQYAAISDADFVR